MAAVHIVHYTSGCHAALGIYGRALAPRPRLFCFCHFTTSRFGKLTSEPLGRKNTPSFATGDKQYILDNDCIYWPLHL